MQVCTSLQTGNHASTPQLSFFTGRMPFLPPNQQRQSTEDTRRLLTFNQAFVIAELQCSACGDSACGATNVTKTISTHDSLTHTTANTCTTTTTTAGLTASFP